MRCEAGGKVRPGKKKRRQATAVELEEEEANRLRLVFLWLDTEFGDDGERS
jgi:hypothetical protein